MHYDDDLDLKDSKFVNDTSLPLQNALEGSLSASILQNVEVLKFCIEKTGSVDICGCRWNIVSPAFCKVTPRQRIV